MSGLSRAAAVGSMIFVLAAAACGGSPGGQGATVPSARALPTGASTRAPQPPLPGDWPTYHGDALRSGNAAGLAPPGRLRTEWTAPLDGAVHGQPLVVRGRVLAATENDSVYALDPGSGRVLWRQHLGTPVPLADLPCGNIDPLGITGTPAYDASTGLVFVVEETGGGRHQLLGLDAASGNVEVSREVEPPRGDRLAHQQRAALAIADGRVYVAFGGLEGDCGQYVGAVVAVPVTGRGEQLSYSVPTRREGGVWAPGGPVVDGSRLLVPVGNGAATGGAYDGSDAVLSLGLSDLRRRDFFAPISWPQDNAEDADLGSLTPVRVGPYVLQVGKRGTAYLLDAGRLGGIGGQRAQTAACPAYGAAAVSGLTVYLPCADGLLQLTVGPGGTLRTGWRFPLGSGGSPVVGGGAVWVADWGTGVLHALDPATGRPRQAIRVGRLPHFASPTPAGNRLFIGTTGGVTAVGGA